MRHRLLLFALDLCVAALATICAQLLRDSFETRPDQLLALLPYFGLTLLVSVPVLAGFGLSRSIWRFSAMPDFLKAVSVSCSASSLQKPVHSAPLALLGCPWRKISMVCVSSFTRR